MGGGSSKNTTTPESGKGNSSKPTQSSTKTQGAVARNGSFEGATPTGKRINMLLLGGPNVGKSTVFRQMTLLYRGGFQDHHRQLAKLQILENILDSVIKVCHLAFRKFDRHFSPENMTTAEQLEELYDDFSSRSPTDATYPCLKEEHWEKIHKLMKDPEFEKTFEYFMDPTRENKSDPLENFKLVDHGAYFLSIIDKVKQDDYLPSDNELLMLRRVTEGRESIEFDIDINLQKPKRFNLKVTDVGGQAHEQEEWKRVCEEEKLDSVIYICALSEFDSVDKNNNNILKSQLSLLAKIVKSPMFEDTDLVVLMNKTDLLEKKLEHKKIQDYFRAFQRVDNSPESVIEHFKCELEGLSRKVLERRGLSEFGRLPLVLPTCALDTQMIEKIVPLLCENALMKKMDESGLM